MLRELLEQVQRWMPGRRPASACPVAWPQGQPIVRPSGGASTCWRTRFASALVGLAALAAIGCDTTKELTRRCSKGDTAACESACDEGVFGEGGCFQAGQAAYREAGSDYAGPEWLRAKTFFEKACEGGHADGCLFVAQAVEAPFTSVTTPKAAPQTAVQAIDDAAIDERRSWLERACEQRHAKGCKRLGDVTIGKKSDVARRAYEQACDLGEKPADCKAARAREVDAFEHYRDGCRRGVADDCTALGDVVFRVDFPRAIRIFLAELELRGLGEHVGGARAFVERRVREAQRARVLDPAATKEPSAGPPAGPSIRWSGLEVDGRLARTFVSRALSGAERRLSACAAERTVDGDEHIELRLVVDRTGDVFTAEVKGADAELAACLRDALEAVQMQPPVGGVAKVRQTLSFTPPSDPAP